MYVCVCVCVCVCSVSVRDQPFHFIWQALKLDCACLFGNIEAVLEASVKLLHTLEQAVDGKEVKDQELGKSPEASVESLPD